MPTPTTTYALSKPTVGGDDNAWGTELNSALDKIDDLFDGTTAIKPNLDAGLWKVGGVAVTSIAAELNILDGVTSTTAELNILDGVTATTAELNFVDGVTSNIQTQFTAKANLDSPALTGTPTAPTATAGTNTTQLATTAFVQTALGGAASYTLLGTLTTTSGSTQTLSGLTLTNYRQLYIDIRAVSASSTTSSFSLAGTDIAAAFDGSASDRWFGIVIVDLDAGTFASNVTRVTSGSTSGSVAPRAGDLTITSASTSISFTSSGTFDAGSILVYGVR
jgi:hypothetical protein